jgi:2,3-bisphosphoglycerate-dependent phosphoglycerate mutase
VASAHLLLPLSEKGREQARAAAEPILRSCEELRLELDPRIEASGLLRAFETATILAEELEARTGLSIRIEERGELVERSFGACNNLRLDKIEATLAMDPRLGPLPQGWRKIPEFRLPVPGAESLQEAGARTATRIATSMDAIPEEDPRDLLRLFVAHAGCLKHAAVQLGALDLRASTALKMDHAQSILVEQVPGGDWVQVAGQWKKRLPKAQPKPPPTD